MRDRFGFPAMPPPTYATPYATRYVGASGSVDNDGHSRDYPTTLRGWYEWWRGTGFQPNARMALIGGTPIRMLLASTKTRDDVDACYIPTDLLVEKFDWEANDAIIDTDEQSIAEGNWATFDWSGIPRDYTVNGGKAHRRYPHGLTFPCSRITVCRVAGYDSPAGGVQFGGNGNLTTNIKVHGMEMGFSYSHGVGFDPLDPFGSAFHTGMDVQWYIGHHSYDDSTPDPARGDRRRAVVRVDARRHPQVRMGARQLGRRSRGALRHASHVRHHRQHPQRVLLRPLHGHAG